MKNLLSLLPAIFLIAFKINAQSACPCYHIRDTSYHPVQFDLGSGFSDRTDDWSSAPIALPFDFCLYGQTFDTVYINMNGNLTFHNRNPYFRGKQMYEVAYPIVAPYWSDADNMHGGGLVYYKLTPTALIVQWDSVPYSNYNNPPDRFNSYQVIISTGTDHLVPSGNVSFCYKDIQYNNGQSTGAVQGVGGHPALAGVSLGDSAHYSQVGSFNYAGTPYDGAFGFDDGFDFLDYKYIKFDACDTLLPSPLVTDSLCNIVLLSTPETDAAASLPLIYPNPTPGVICISSAAQTFDRIEIYNATGQLIQQHFPQQENIFRVELETAGIYFVKVYTGDSITTQKVIRNN